MTERPFDGAPQLSTANQRNTHACVSPWTKVGDKALSLGETASDDAVAYTRTTGGPAVTIRPEPGSRHPGYPRTDPTESPDLWTAHRSPETVAFEREHSRLYLALERAAQLAEIADHNALAASLRRERNTIAAEVELGIHEAADGR